MSFGTAAAALTLAVAALACTAQPRHVAPVVKGQPEETVAPQDVGTSPVNVVVSPARLRAGVVRVMTSLRATGRWFTASHVWLDRLVGQRWITAWLLAKGVSVSLEDYARGGIALTSDAVTVPSTLTFAFDSLPSPGSYRLRIEVGGAAPASEGGPAPSWATASLEVLAS